MGTKPVCQLPNLALGTHFRNMWYYGDIYLAVSMILHILPIFLSTFIAIPFSQVRNQVSLS